MSVSGSARTGSALSAQIETSALTRTLSGIVRSELPTIEAALRHGLRYDQLCQHFAALGVTVTPGTLRQTVYRLRRENSRGSGELSRTSRQGIPEEAVSTRNTTASTSDTAVVAKAPLAPEPRPIPPTLSDKIPLLSQSAQTTAQPSGQAAPPDFITAIRQSSPDLDVLAYRYRQSQQRGSPAAKAISLNPASSADLTSNSSSPGSTSS